MKKIVALLICLISISCSTQDQNTVNIGVILPLSGSLSDEGQKGLAAIKLAEKRINESNEYPIKINLMIEDGCFTGKNSLAAYNKLMLKDVSAFVSFGTPPTQAIKDRIDGTSIPLFAIDGSSGLAKSSEWIFVFLTPTQEIGEAAGLLANSRWASSKMALLTMNISGGDDFALGFNASTGKDAYRETFESSATDVRPQILKLLNQKPEVIAVFGYGVGYTTAINQLLESGYDGAIITDANITSITDNLKKGSKDIYFVSQNFGDYSNNPQSQEFINNVKLESNIEPTLFSAYLYEIINVIATSSNIDGAEPKDIQRNTLALKDHSTMFGPMSFSSDGDIHLPFIGLKLSNSSITVIDDFLVE